MVLLPTGAAIRATNPVAKQCLISVIDERPSSALSRRSVRDPKQGRHQRIVQPHPRLTIPAPLLNTTPVATPGDSVQSVKGFISLQPLLRHIACCSTRAIEEMSRTICGTR